MFCPIVSGREVLRIFGFDMSPKTALWVSVWAVVQVESRVASSGTWFVPRRRGFVLLFFFHPGTMSRLDVLCLKTQFKMP